jgi:hypothetical protein
MTTAPSLHELVVHSTRPDELEQWYRDALALPGGRRRLHAGGVLMRFSADPSLPVRACEPMRLMPNFVVDDASSAERRLVAMGATWIRELEATEWGRIATVLDPDGNYVQLFELPSTDGAATP